MLAQSFLKCERGVVAMTTGLILIPIVLVAAVGVDLARLHMVESKLVQAVDSAALAAARVAGTEFQDDDLQQFFDANFPDGYMGTVVEPLDVDYNDVTGQVEVIARATMPTSIMRVAHIDTMDVTARSLVVRKQVPMEVALVLDVTGSMGGSKILALKQSAEDLLNILFGSAAQSDDLAVAIVPFSARVRVGNEYDEWLDGAAPGGWNGCVEVRAGDPGTDATIPADAEFDPSTNVQLTGWYYNGYQWVYGAYTANPPCPTKMQPLTGTKSTLVTKVQSLAAGGTTRTDIGAIWGWRAVSADWGGIWDADPGRPSDDDDVIKAVVLMTDGQNVPNYSSLSTAQADARLAEVCENMKENGVIVYSITFQAPLAVDPLFRDCASDVGKFYKSPTAADLRTAFQLIAGQLSELRIAE